MPVLQGALLCDAAHDYGGLVSILGGFVAAMYVPQLPVPAPVWFAGRVAFFAEEMDQPHDLLVAAYSPDNALLGEVRGTVDANADLRASAIPEIAAGVNVVFPFPFPIFREGIHWVSFSVDGDELVRLPLKAIVGRPPA